MPPRLGTPKVPILIAVGGQAPWVSAGIAARQLVPHHSYSFSSMMERRSVRVGYGVIRLAFPVILLFTLIAGDALRYTIGWAGWAVLVVALALVSIVILVREKASWRLAGLPYPLLTFLVLTAVSIFWSYYPGATALGSATTIATAAGALAIAVVCTWGEVLRALAWALRAILGLSILFELYVSLIVRSPILPLVPEPGIDYSALFPVPPMLYWSRNELFHIFTGGKIQGILGNSVLLSFAALLGLIVFTLELLRSRNRPVQTALWIGIAAFCLAASRSATIIAATVVVILIALAVALVRRARSARTRAITYGGLAAVIVLVAVLVSVFNRQILALLGKSEDLTGRVDIWATVANLASQRPILGWGWVSYWVPWAAPFDTLVTRNGVRQLHAHNAWLDVWFQLGVIGLVVFGALVLTAVVRSWWLAVDAPQRQAAGPGPYRVETVLPILVLTALLVQSVAESRLLVEFGMFFLVLVSVKTKVGARAAIPGSTPFREE